MKQLIALSALLAISSPGFAQTGTPVPLWPGGAPDALGSADTDIPTLTPYIVESASPTAAIVVCPGGGYGGLAAHEGHDYALWLNQHGVSALVLKYRLGSKGYHHPSMLNDAQRAIRTVRANAKKWNIDSSRVGIMGSSAGGHLASTALTHFDSGKADSADPIDRESCRPDFGILCYAVITLGEHTHKGSRNNLLGENPDPGLIDFLSSEKQVTDNTPPCFIWHTWEDTAVDVENSLQFAAALRAHNVPFDLHVYQKGRHGIGLNDKPPFKNAHPWANDLAFWFSERGITQK